MSRLLERPRVAIAKAVAIVLIALAGAGAALLAFDDGESVQDQAAQLERARATQARELEGAQARAAELERRANRLERRARALGRRNRALTGELARVRRALRRARE